MAVHSLLLPETKPFSLFLSTLSAAKHWPPKRLTANRDVARDAERHAAIANEPRRLNTSRTATKNRKHVGTT